MNIQKITAKEAIPVRHKVLWPDKPLSFCMVDGDDSAIHYGAFVHDKLVCVASIYITDNEARLRKFATLEQYQGQGIGSKVIEYTTANLKQLNIKYFWCDARLTAKDFYQRFGLTVQGSEFKKSGVSYYKMSVHWH